MIVSLISKPAVRGEFLRYEPAPPHSPEDPCIAFSGPGGVEHVAQSSLCKLENEHENLP